MTAIERLLLHKVALIGRLREFPHINWGKPRDRAGFREFIHTGFLRAESS
jgi:hypothetical protein